MKILFVSPRLPYPLAHGGDIRTFYFVREVAKYHDTTLLALVTSEDQFELVKKAENELCPVIPVRYSLERRWKAHFKYFFSPVPYYRNVAISPETSFHLKRLVEENDYDLVQIEFLCMAHFVEDVNGPVTVLDMHNVESILFSRMLKILPLGKEKILGMFDNVTLREYEASQIRKFDACLTCSDLDRDILIKSSACESIFAIPNGVDTDFFQPGAVEEESASVVFVGSYSYYPNVDAVIYFCNEIMPQIQESRKDTKLFIVGHSPPKEVEALTRRNGVIVTGFVEDVREYMGRATVFAVPLRSGSGTRLKILEAWAMGKAVVSTSLGAEGLWAKQNENILIADDPASFAESIIDMINDKKRRVSLGMAGRDTVEKMYDWTLIGGELMRLYDSLHV